MSTGTVDAAVEQWWHGVLADAPAQVELPQPAAATADPDGGGTGTVPAGADLALAVAGWLARYSVTGIVALTVDDGPHWRPVVLDLADLPTRAVARERLTAALTAAREHELELLDLAAGLGTEQREALRQVAVGATAWPLSQPPQLRVTGTDGGFELAGAGAADRRAVLTGHLQRVLDGWTDDVALSAVPLEDEPAWRTHWAGPEVALPEATVWDLVREQADRTPAAEAVVDARTRLTYAELVQRVHGRAAALLASGVEPDQLVGICVRRSAEMVISMLAAHAVGAAYVPIDPAYPVERIAMMIEDAELRVVMTEPDLLTATAGITRVHVTDPVGPGGELPALADPLSRLAYVIFTSGSTGRPKGVMIEHRALTNFVLSIAERPGVAGDDRLLAVTTLSFDIAALELLVPLVTGGCVVVADADDVVDPDRLATLLERESITIMQATPATWSMLVDSGWPGWAGLRVLCGGEALPVALAARLARRCAELWNMYGPTETTIWSLATQVEAGTGIDLGTPLANTTVLVAGRAQEPVPAGVAGELLIGGDGLARGYLRQPEQTAARFPTVAVPGLGPTRLYRTGDLVRRDADGRLRYLGRMDNQVKVRGFRIELGEVETALGRHPAVARAAVVVRPDARTGANELAAFAVLEPGARAGERDLRTHLADALPAYMVPSSLVVLTDFPHTPNGKIDRRALADIVVEHPEHPGGEVAPRTELEARLLAVWRDVLARDDLGVTDHIFDLGASSLVTARLFGRIARELDIELPIAAAFEAPTVERLAQLIESRRAAAGPDDGFRSLVAIRPEGSRAPLFLVHGGAGTILLYEPLARRLPADQPVYALQAAGLYGQHAPHRSVPQMARSYVEEIRRVAPHGPYRLGGYCFGALVAFEMARLLTAAGERVDLLVSFNGPSPSYLRQYKPRFDADGARTDEFGNPIRRPARPAGASRPAARTVGVGRWQWRPPRRLRAAVRKARRRLLVLTATTLHRPLPEHSREAGMFQDIAGAAQRRYGPPRWAGDILVVRGDGLYHRDDVGWSDHVEGSVQVVGVAGTQLTPRRTMTDQFVGPVADAIAARLAESSAAPAT